MIPENQYKYNGVELDVQTQTYETFFRGYNAALGRFNQIDPLSEIVQGISSYHFGFNNPITFIDPLGLMGNDPKKKKKSRKSSRTRDPEKDSDKPKPTPKPKPNSGSGVTPMNDKVEIVQEVNPDVIRGDGFEITIKVWDPGRIRRNEYLNLDQQGTALELGVKLDDLEQYTDIDWVQTVYSNNGIAGAEHGAYSDGLNPPRYYGENLSARTYIINGFKIYFEDFPHRVLSNDFTFWRAELSLVGKRNGRFERIFTLLWGFTLHNQKVLNAIKPYLWEPTNDHVEQINSVK